MSLGGKILRNSTYLTLGDKVGYLIQFIFFLYFARKFGVVPVGEYSFAFFFTYAFSLLANLGVTVYLVREVARNSSSDRQLFFDCLVLRAVSIFIVFLLALAMLLLFFNDISAQKLKIIGYWGVYWIFYSLADVFLAELNGHEKMGRVALLGILLKVMSTISGVFLIYLDLDYDVVLIVFPISGFFYLCACGLVSIYSLGAIHIKFRKFAYYTTFFVELIPFFLTVILVEVLNFQDILILGIIQDDQSVGIYSSAVKIVSFILGVSAFIQIAILPVLSRLFVESQEKLIEISKKILRYLILSGLPISLGLIMTSDKIINMLYSDLFQEASVVLKITGLTIVLAFIQVIFSTLLTAINRQKEKVIFIGINFALSILLSVFLIHHFNYIGAAVVKLISTFLGLIFFAYLVSKYLVSLSVLRSIFKPALACLIMTIFIHYLNHWGLLYLIPVSGFIYVISLLVVGGLTQKEIRFIKNLVFRKLYDNNLLKSYRYEK